MGIEDEFHELVFRIKLKHLDGKLAQDIRTLIEKKVQHQVGRKEGGTSIGLNSWRRKLLKS